MEELPEEAVEAAEEQSVVHVHDRLDDADLREHLRSQHRLDVPEHLSGSTLEGVHDRLHGQTNAVDD